MRKILSKLQFAVVLCLSFTFFSQSALAQAEGWQELNNKTLELLRNGEYTAAISAAYTAHQSAVKEYGYKHHNYIASLHNVAIALTKAGNYDQARHLFNNALQTSKKVFGEEHVVYAISAYRLGDLLQLVDQSEGALKLYEVAVPILKEKEGNNSFHYTTAMSQLANLYLNKGEALKAEETLVKSYTEIEQCNDCTAADLAKNLHLLANTYSNMGRNKEASTLYQKVLLMRADTQGKTHPEYAETLHDYALQLSKKEKDIAIGILQDALAIKATSLGKKHPAYLKCADDLKKLNGLAKTSMAD